MRTLAETNAKSFSAMMCDALSPELRVRATNDVALASGEKPPRGLFALELVVGVDAKGFPRFAYATDLDQFEPTLLDVFATGIQTLHGVKSLEPAIMSEMNWTWWPTLVATGVNDEVVQMAREAMMRHLRVAVGKLKEYLKLYDEYLPLLRLDVAKYVEETRRRDPEEEEGRLAAYLAEIAEHETQLARVEEMVPRRIVVGCFHVDVSEVRKALWEKRGTGGEGETARGGVPREKSPTR